jgi:hypothetical protein
MVMGPGFMVYDNNGQKWELPRGMQLDPTPKLGFHLTNQKGRKHPRVSGFCRSPEHTFCRSPHRTVVMCSMRVNWIWFGLIVLQPQGVAVALPFVWEHVGSTCGERVAGL